VPLNPKWLEILKASGWQTTAITCACGLFLLMVRWGWLPPLNPWVIPSVTFALLLCGCLALASVASATFKLLFSLLPIEIWIVHWVTLRREKRAVRDYIPHMTPHERKITSYLLAKNQKMFTAAADGGYATTLIFRGIVVRAFQPGQVFGYQDMPLAIPDHIWEVLLKHKDQFPYQPPQTGEPEVHPWRVPWMVR